MIAHGVNCQILVSRVQSRPKRPGGNSRRAVAALQLINTASPQAMKVHWLGTGNTRWGYNTITGTAATKTEREWVEVKARNQNCPIATTMPTLTDRREAKGRSRVLVTCRSISSVILTHPAALVATQNNTPPAVTGHSPCCQKPKGRNHQD